MSFRTKGLVLAMEDDEVVEPTQVAATPEVPAAVEQEVAEVQEDGNEVADLNDALEDAEDAADGLEQVIDQGEEAVDSGEGLPEKAAEVAEIAVESFYSRLGIRRKAIPSMEAFGSSQSRVHATQTALEDWKESLAKAWQAIKTFFGQLWAKIVLFVKKLVGTNKQLISAAEQLKKQAEAGGKAKENAFKNASVYRAFAKTGNLKAGDVKGVLETHLKVIADAQALTDSVVAEAKKLEGVVEKAGKGQKEGLIEEINTIVGGIKFGALNAKGLVFGTEFAVTTGGGEGDKQFVQVDVVQKPASAATPVCDTPTTGDIKGVCDLVIKVLEANGKLCENSAAVEKIEKQFNELIDKAIKACEGAAEGADQSALSAARAAVTAVGRSSSKIISKVPSLSVQAAKAALNYVGGALAQYKAEAKAPEAK